MKRSVSCVIASAVLVVACGFSSDEDGPVSDESDLSLSNLANLARNKIDRSKVDPYNPWAQTRLGIGEENWLPDEAAEFEGYAKVANAIQRGVKDQTDASRPLRTFHAKAHACVRGELTIDNSALPEGARVGIFAENATYPTWARFSNGMSNTQGDRKIDVRGFAVKIMGVAGPRMISRPEDEAATTQDFLMADQDVAPAPDPRHMVEFAKAMAAAKDSDGIFGRIEALASVGAFLTRDENVRIVDFFVNRVRPQVENVGSPLGDVFYSAAPNALGLEAGDPNTARAKGAFKLMATAGILDGDRCVPKNEKPNQKDPDYIRTALARELAQGDVCVDFAVQLQTDGTTEPIEDVSVPWKTPFTKFGRLTFGKIDLAQEEASEAACNDFSFTPWHTLREHRPLGSAMRARRVVLAASASLRGATGEPTP